MMEPGLYEQLLTEALSAELDSLGARFKQDPRPMLLTVAVDAVDAVIVDADGVDVTKALSA